MFSKKERYYANCDSRVLRPLLRRPLFPLFIHWVFQGMLYMDRTERLFKLGIDVVVTLGIAYALRGVLHPVLSACIALVLAHTGNALFNGQVWSVLKYYDMVTLGRDSFDDYIRKVVRRLEGQTSITYAAVYGSEARGEWSPTSDLDIRLVRRPGIANALRACAFTTTERAMAFVARFPLDIYVFDSRARLRQMREGPVILKDLADEGAQAG